MQKQEEWIYSEDSLTQVELSWALGTTKLSGLDGSRLNFLSAEEHFPASHFPLQCSDLHKMLFLGRQGTLRNDEGLQWEGGIDKITSLDWIQPIDFCLDTFVFVSSFLPPVHWNLSWGMNISQNALCVIFVFISQTKIYLCFLLCGE